MFKLGDIDIIGIKYEVFYHSDFMELQEKAKERDKRYGQEKDHWENLDGYCDYSQKEIHVYNDIYQKPEYFRMVLRHEICHAYLFEIGYAGHGDEELIDKLSKWIPQINKIFNEGQDLINGYIKPRKQTKPNKRRDNESSTRVQ